MAERDDSHNNLDELVRDYKKALLVELIPGLAHEINNPAGFVTGNLGTFSEYVEVFKRLLEEYGLLADAVRENRLDDAREALERIDQTMKDEDVAYILEDVGSLLSESEEGMARVVGIMEGLRRFGREEKKQTEADIDLNDSIRAALRLVWNELKYTCEVQKDLNTLPVFRCSTGRFEVAFGALLLHVAEAVNESGEISVLSQAENGHIVIRFSGKGKGKTDPESRGMNVARGIVEAHAGTIRIDCRPGEGTSVEVRLPSGTTPR